VPGRDPHPAAAAADETGGGAAPAGDNLTRGPWRAPAATRGGRDARRRREVERALTRWPRPPEPPPGEGVVRPLPRPSRLDVAWSADTAARVHPPDEFRASALRSFARLFVWLVCAVRFFAGVLWDRLRGRTGTAARARRLRRTLERAGPTFVKLGQQLSIRLDLLPYAYAVELQRMLDDMEPLPPDVALAEISRALGRPLEEVFQALDPKPIGSASVACVYQAYLRNGDRVAVKLRRPGIGELLVADIRALGWTLRLLEHVVLPPGFTANFVFELRDMLVAELDFRKEARSIELFEDAVRKAKLDYVRTPKVYFDHTRRNMLVIELVTGTWLTEILGALESDDRAALAELRRRRIDPKVVARRYLKINRFGAFEGPLFHADLHPANVLVQPDDRIVLIDFGSVGSFPEHELQVWRRMLDAQADEDVGGMVRAGVALLEPLPLIDVDEFSKRMEQAFCENLWATKSRHSEWWERTWANLWVHFFELAREYNVPMRLNTLRMIRVTMLADTIAMRLDHDLDPWAEFREYERESGRRARKRVHRRVRRNLGPKRWIRTEQLLYMADAAVFRVQRLLDDTTRLYSFTATVGRVAGTVMILAKAALALVVAGGTWVLATAGLRLAFPTLGGSTDPVTISRDLLANGWVQAALVAAGLLVARRLRYQLAIKVDERRRD